MMTAQEKPHDHGWLQWDAHVYDAAAAEPATVQLAGVLAPGAAYVVAGAESADAFYATFGFHADLYSSVAFGNGNDPVQVTGPLGQVDTFGQVGADGFGQPWDYTDSAAVRLPGVLEGAAEWVATEVAQAHRRWRARACESCRVARGA